MPGPGREIWNTKIADITDGETTPMAPLVVKDRVIVGPSGGEFGIHGWVKALDVASGTVVWTAHNAGPDADMLVRPGRVQAVLRPGPDLGLTSWPKDAWKQAGAPVWGWLSYDPELDLLYFGVGNPGPYNAEQRAGRQQVDQQRPRAPARRWLTGLGVPVHAARQLGLRLQRREHPRRHPDQRHGPEDPAPFRQERLCLHDRPRHRRGAGRASRSCP